MPYTPGTSGPLGNSLSEKGFHRNGKTIAKNAYITKGFTLRSLYCYGYEFYTKPIFRPQFSGSLRNSRICLLASSLK
jgi:hypothetical protein